MYRVKGGRWELLASATGNQDALAMSIVGVSAEEIEKGFSSSKVVSPSFMAERIEAISVYDQSIIKRLSYNWKSLKDVEEDDYIWGIAWSSALRFLVEQELKREDGVKNLEIATELYTLAPQLNEHISWLKLKDKVMNGKFYSYNDFRVISSYDIMEDSVDITNLGINNLYILRVLRGRFHLLNNQSLDRLNSLIELNESVDPLILSLIIEIFRELNPDTVDLIKSRFFEKFIGLGDPEEITPSFYSVLNPFWVVA